MPARTWALLALALPAAVAAQPAPPRPPPIPGEPRTHAFGYSRYEQATIQEALDDLGLTPAPQPEGKTVEAIVTVRLEVIEERDPAPRFLNVFHVVTRSAVIEREVLLRPGDPYRQTLVDETQRNLATFPQLSLVLVIAAEGSAPGTVRVIVITKDVWSLRLNWDIALTTAGLEGLTINPSETNFLGTHQTLGLSFDWLPLSSAFGLRYVVPRIAGSHVAASADAGLVFNNGSGAREGSFGDFALGSPLWSSRTEWAWSVGASWLEEVTRRYVQAKVAAFALDPATDCSVTPALCVPYVYRTEAFAASASLTRSFGWALKQDVSLGFDVRRSRYTLPDVSAYDPATVQAFQETRVPVGETRVGPWVQYQTYTTEFLRVLDLETLALQEDFRLGGQGYLRLYPVLRALGSTRDLFGITAGASWTQGVDDGLARVSVDTVTEIAAGEVSDGSVRAELRLDSPRSALGRVVLDAVVLDRYANSLNRLTALGGDTRLRGYPSQWLLGANVVAANVEYRSRPWQILESIQLAGVLFYDAGDAFDRWDELRWWHAVGFGARVLLPQLDRVVFRVDVGFPLVRAGGIDPVAFFATFGQAFPP